jgi:SAM-dependent methyltransferase
VTREQRTVFGEVAEQYDRARPGYPDELFDIVLTFGDVVRGGRALEVGAGTGKATLGFAARGLDVTALEPSMGMAALLRRRHASVVTTTFEDWCVERGAFRLVFAAQAWHWVNTSDRYARAAEALEPGGAIALFWNLPQPFEPALRADIDAAYASHAPELAKLTEQWPLDGTLDELNRAAQFEAATKRVVKWTQRYTAGEYADLMGTHSHHRLLDDTTRNELQDAVRTVLTRHGGRVDVEYHTAVYLARRLR